MLLTFLIIIRALLDCKQTESIKHGTPNYTLFQPTMYLKMTQSQNLKSGGFAAQIGGQPKIHIFCLFFSVFSQNDKTFWQFRRSFHMCDCKNFMSAGVVLKTHMSSKKLVQESIWNLAWSRDFCLPKRFFLSNLFLISYYKS